MNRIKSVITKIFSKRINILFTIFLLLLTLVFFIQQNKMKKQMELKVQFIEQKNMLRDELDDLIDDHDELLNEYGDLNNQLHEKDSVIQYQISEIRNLIRTQNDLAEAKKKIAILKEISKKYLSNIDSLLLINETLNTLNDSVIRENKNINWKNYKLSKQNQKLAEKVSRGSILEVLDIEVDALRYRRTGKEVSTRFAKKVQKIRFCCTIGANLISDAEEKKVFMQLIAPNGEVIKGVEDVKVSVSDSIFYCTSFFTFNYNNIEINNCFEWERIQQLESGDYILNLIIEGKIAVRENFSLR